MTKVQLPVDYESAISEMRGIAVLLDKNGWKAAAFIATYVKPDANHGRPPKTRTSASFHVSAVKFATDVKARGWSENVITRHYTAWQAAAQEGIVPEAEKLVAGEKIEVPADGWEVYYSRPVDADPRYTAVEDREAILAQAKLDGVGGSKAVDIAKNPKSMAAAIIASPKVAEAATKALIDRGDVANLSKATATASKNRYVERNRARAAEGLPRTHSIEDKRAKATIAPDAGSAAFLTVHGLADALRSLVTTFPKEWAELSEAARKDEDFVAVCIDTIERIDLALTHIRVMINDGAEMDRQLIELLEGDGNDREA